MLIFCIFIQVYVFTTNHNLKSLILTIISKVKSSFKTQFPSYLIVNNNDV